MASVSRHSTAWYIVGGLLGLLIVMLITARIYLSIWLLHYVNHVLGNIPGYQGSVESINVDLYRGAYRINKLKLSKSDGHIPTPFIAIETTDLSLQWSALFHGRIVSSATLIHPVITFAANDHAKQTGVGVDWTKPIKDLAPIDINYVLLKDGELAYQDFASHPQVNVYIHHMEGEVRNLRNVVDESHPLPSRIFIKGTSIGEGKLQIAGRMNILKPIPDMDLLVQLENVHLTALSDYSNAYASVDFKGGDFSVYSEVIVKDNHVSGYIKPVAHDIAIIDLRKTSNPLKIAWESLVALVVNVFTNHTHEQFATKIALEGNLGNISTNTWSAIEGILHNAFVEALQKGLDDNGQVKLQDRK